MLQKAQVQNTAIQRKASLCLGCTYKIELLTEVPRYGLLQVKPENISVRVDCFIAGENAKPCPTEERRERRIAHHKNKPAV